MNKYQFPFGEYVHSLKQEDRTPKKVFVLGVYASAVHACWYKGMNIISTAIAVASEPRIFWDGNEKEAWEIIKRIHIPPELGKLRPASSYLNGPSAKVLDNDILAPLGYSRKDSWLCDCLPQTRLNSNQVKLLNREYNPIREQYGLNEVTIPVRPTAFCSNERAAEITDELMKSQAETLILLGDIPMKQYLKKVADVPYNSLNEYIKEYGYGADTVVTIGGKQFKLIPLVHPRQIGGLAFHNSELKRLHLEWEKTLR